MLWHPIIGLGMSKTIVLKFPSDQIISLRIINGKQESNAGEIHSRQQTTVASYLIKLSNQVAT